MDLFERLLLAAAALMLCALGACGPGSGSSAPAATVEGQAPFVVVDLRPSITEPGATRLEPPEPARLPSPPPRDERDLPSPPPSSSPTPPPSSPTSVRPAPGERERAEPVAWVESLIEAARRRVRDGTSGSVTDLEVWVVARGDTISSVAAATGIGQRHLLRANDLTFGDWIRPGQRLQLRPRTDGRWTVRRGQTFSAIARVTGVPAAALMAANGCSDPRRLRAGSTLLIPGEAR